MAVYVSNITVNTDVDFAQTFTLEDSSSNAALDLTGYSVAAQLRKWGGAADTGGIYCCNRKTNFTTTIVSSTGGRIKIALADTITKDLKPGRHVYDIVVTDGSGNKTRVVEGSVLVRQGVTR